MVMTWEKLLFAHWPVPAASLQALLPSGLEIETFEGQAYFALVPFAMSGVQLTHFPPIPGTHRFLEMNMRTYVRHPASGKTGVWFLSLDSNSRLSNWAARTRFHLRYLDAEMSMQGTGDEIRYESVRQKTGEAYAPYPKVRGPKAAVTVTYRPTGGKAVESELTSFFTNRYRLFSCSRDGRLFAAEVDHEDWSLKPATATFERLEITDGLGISLEGEPHLLYSDSIAVRGWLPYAL